MNFGFFTSGVVGVARTCTDLADRPSVGYRLAFGGSKAKTGEQIGEQILFFCYLMPL